MVRWVVGSILFGGSIDLFLVPASAARLVYQRPRCVLSCMWDGAHKITLAANRKTGPDGAVAMSSANGLVDTGIASQYQFQPRSGLKRPNG